VTDSARRPPLAGLRIIELAGIGPGPFAGMMLADLGAEVITVDRLGGNPSATIGHSILFRSRRSVTIDLKSPQGVEALLRLCERSDALMEGFRPGVAERLGIGPDECMARNPALVYGRITGWGQEGPLARMAGHDLNYIALTGALHAIGREGQTPTVPLNLIGDFGGGGMLLAFGVLAGVLSARADGRGTVIDAAMIDGASALMAMFHGLRSEGLFDDERGTHTLDGGAHFYDVYETADGRFVSIGALEPQFYVQLCDLLDLDDEVRNAQYDLVRWPEFSKRVAAAVQQRTRDELDALFAGSDACYAPVLAMEELARHPHHAARSTFVVDGNDLQPAPAPRFDGQPPTVPTPRPASGIHTIEVLRECGFTDAEIATMSDNGVIDAV